MAKTEYYEPKLLEGEREQPGILVDAVALLELYLRALPMMNATDRKRYGDKAVSLILDVIADFQMAYDFDHGAALGNQHWQVAQNYDLNDFDHWQVDTCRVHYGRFVDDMWWIFTDKERGLAHIAESERKLREEYGYEMHPDKRYCQHYTKGGKFISTPFRLNRIYVNNSVVNRCLRKIRWWNRHVGIMYIGHFTACINSYFGRMKRLNAYGIIRNLVEKIAPRWWRFCYYNDRRRCVLPNIEYTRNELLKRKYNFKYHTKNGKTTTYYNGGFVPLPAPGVA